MFISGFIEESVVDGEGVRSVVFISGCRHHCQGCHNPETWSFAHGKPFTLDEQMNIINRVKDNPLIEGLTISGGDPVYSSEEVIDFIKLYKRHFPEHSIWLYTGFTYEEVLEQHRDLLEEIDVLVDSLFDKSKQSYSCRFKGSTNQRVIDVKESLRLEDIIIIPDKED